MLRTFSRFVDDVRLTSRLDHPLTIIKIFRGVGQYRNASHPSRISNLRSHWTYKALLGMRQDDLDKAIVFFL